MTTWVYDLETFPNCFTMSVVYHTAKGMRTFEISDRKNQSEEMLEFLRNVVRNEHKLAGFNNIGFDYPILHYILLKAKKAFAKEKPAKFTAAEIYREAQEVIDAVRNNDRFGKRIKDSEVIIPQIDLYLVHHFDNKARATSLKTLEINMRSDNVQDLPFEVGTVLTHEQMDVLIKYNQHDVSETLKFFNFSKEALDLRAELTEQYGFDCTNFNDTKIGKQLFINTLEQENPGCCYTVTERGRKLRQTKRDKIHLKDCIFPYVKFELPEFQAVLDWFRKQTITETKGVFSDIDEANLGELAKYCKMTVKQKKFKGKPSESELMEFYTEHPKGWIMEQELKATEWVFDAEGNHVMYQPVDEQGNAVGKPKKQRKLKVSYWGCWNVAETFNTVINGFQYDFGVGGIHGAKRGIHKATAERKIYTYDVASFYPNMAIANEIHPEHLGKTFCKVYKDLYDQRKASPKGSAKNAALKLALNGTYGASGDEFSPLYDPQFTMSITVGGQVTLCMLMEQLIIHCNAEIIMCNTDGFEFIADPVFEDKIKELVKQWEETTGLQMEGANYSSMFIRDVNNYISVTTEGKVKLKGAFEYADYRKLGWHKNHSAMVIAKAVEQYFVYGVDYEEFIMLHNDKYDFILRTKVPRSSKLLLVDELGNEEQQQNNSRYYPSSSGGYLVKIMPALEGSDEERRFDIDKNVMVSMCNNIKEFDFSKLNRRYFVEQAKKLVESVEQADLSIISKEESDESDNL